MPEDRRLGIARRATGEQQDGDVVGVGGRRGRRRFDAIELAVFALQRRLRDRRLTLAVTPDARAWLSERGYDPAFGARPLRRLIQSEIQDRLAMAILSGGVHDGDLVRVDVAADGSALVLTSSGPTAAAEDDADDDVIEAELLED